MYGNTHALDALLRAADADNVELLVFNGDFNWFNGDEETFTQLNRRLMKLCDEGRAICTAGNVEREIASNNDDGCGCGYPDYVSDAAVERSNNIIRGLKTVRKQAPEGKEVAEWLDTLPSFVKINVGGLTVGVVHGDAVSPSCDHQHTHLVYQTLGPVLPSLRSHAPFLCPSLNLPPLLPSS
jgi:predicted phosphodiesterase